MIRPDRTTRWGEFGSARERSLPMRTPPSAATMTLSADGAEYRAGAARGDLPTLLAFAQTLSADRAGVRLGDSPQLQPILAPSGSVGALVGDILGPNSRPVRAILFDKTPQTNWSLAWHQDRTICVRERIDVPGFGPWTIKQGMLHVAPPFAVLARMITVRVHLDDVPADNAPLLIAPGSHREGRIAVPGVAAVVRRCGQRACLAQAGDMWLYATPILHASEAATRAASRRVLQVDYAADDLPGGLEWAGA